MINRVLIRIKVVQLLYSYLLTDNPFSLEVAPTSPTREKRFAYGLYLDTLALMTKLASMIQKRGGDCPLERNRFVRIISADERMRSQMAKYRSEGFRLEPVLDELRDKLKNSAIYKKYIKIEEPTLSDDVRLWKEVFDLIILPDPAYNAVVKGYEFYTLRGVDRMSDLMHDTLTKIMSTQILLSDAKKQLATSMEKARELYLRLMLLPVELTELRDMEIDENRHKILPTEEDLNPSMKFVENRLVARLAADSTLREVRERGKVTWHETGEYLLRRLLREIMESPEYKEYMSSPVQTMKEDAEFWRSVFKNVILTSEDFLEVLEEKSIFWNDDLEIISTFVLKSFRKAEDSEIGFMLPMYKDREDAEFGPKLFETVAKNRADYRLLLDECLRTDSWEMDRLAFMDVVIIITAVAELLNFPKIPVKVTVNEYIEISKAYSTSRSGVFVNGILATIITHLRETGKLVKAE